MHCNFALGKRHTYILQIFMLLSISQPLVGAVPCCHLIWQLIFIFSVLGLAFYLFLVLNFFSYYCMLITISSFHGEVMVFCRSSHIEDLIDSNWCVQYGSSWVAFCCTSLRSEIMEQCILPYLSWLLTWLHSTTIFSRFANFSSKEWFFNFSLRKHNYLWKLFY